MWIYDGQMGNTNLKLKSKELAKWHWLICLWKCSKRSIEKPDKWKRKTGARTNEWQLARVKLIKSAPLQPRTWQNQYDKYIEVKSTNIVFS